MKTKEYQTVTSAVIRVCRDSLKGFNRYMPQPLDVVFGTALARASEALPMVKLEYLREEILCRIINGKLITLADIDHAEEMIEELKTEIL